MRVEKWRLNNHSRFIVVSFRTYPVEQFASRAKVEAEVEVVCSLESICCDQTVIVKT